MSMSRFLSPKELAQAIGVSESSLKRWADDGLLEVTRTAGGHRRIALREAIRYIRQQGMPVVKPEVLGMSELALVPHEMGRAGLDEALIVALHEGNAELARGIALSAYLSGRPVAEICDGPLTDSMHRVGDLWRHGPQGIFIEHRAVDLCIQVLSQLRSLSPLPAKDAPLALGGSVEGDPYMLPTLMAAVTLGSAGWRAVNLGPNLPVPALLEAIKKHLPALVWISCSTEESAERQDRALRQAGRELAASGVRIVTGGRAWQGSRWEPETGIVAAGSMAELSAFAEGLRSAAR